MNQKKQIAAQLEGVKLDFNAYGLLPMREDVLLFVAKGDNKQAPIKQWEKLMYLRNHLKALDKYIKENKGETVNEWRKTHNSGFSQEVLKKIGNANNETLGITAYFLNLQNYFDEQEEAYDKIEAASEIPADCAEAIKKLRGVRDEKRKIRRVMRKATTKQMKADGKGYIEVDLGEETDVTKEKSADGQPDESVPVSPSDEKATEKQEESLSADLEKKTSKIGVWIAGTVIFVAVAAAVAAIATNANNSK